MHRPGRTGPTPAGQCDLLHFHSLEGSIAFVVHGSSCHGWLCPICSSDPLEWRCCTMLPSCRMDRLGPHGQLSFDGLFPFHPICPSPPPTSFSFPFEPGIPPFPVRIEREISRVCAPDRMTRPHEICCTSQSTCCDVLRRAAHDVRACALACGISRTHSTSRACGKDVEDATRGTKRVVRRGSFGRNKKKKKKDRLRIRSSHRSHCCSLRRAKQAQISRNDGFERVGRRPPRNERSCET